MEHNVDEITVIGAGAMGSQIAMVAALAGFPTTVVDLNENSLKQAREQLWSRLARDIQKGRRDAIVVQQAKSLLQFSTDQDAAVATTDFVIEAVLEDRATKREIFAQLDRTAPEHAILTTNSSNIMSSEIADVTACPDKVCNMHFFQPCLGDGRG